MSKSLANTTPTLSWLVRVVRSLFLVLLVAGLTGLAVTMLPQNPDSAVSTTQLTSTTTQTEEVVGFDDYASTTATGTVPTTTPAVVEQNTMQSILSKIPFADQVATVTRSVKKIVTKRPVSTTTKSATTTPSAQTPTQSETKKNTAPTASKAATAPPSVGLDYRFGIAAGETLSVLSEADLARRLDYLRDVGVGWIRADLAWSSVQPNSADEYHWENFDRVVRLANARGMRVLPIITYTPRWARADACPDNKKCRPRDPAEYARFARAAVERYAPKGVRTWEVWNEPNLGIFWGPSADAALYTQLLKQAYTAIHAADSGATVVSGGLAPTSTGGRNIAPRQYLEEMYAHGAKGSFDAVGFHPYSFPLSPTFYNKTNAWSQMADTEWSIRSVMAANGDSGKKVWLTEYGAPTGGPGSIANSNDDRGTWENPDHVTESYQATILKEAIQMHRTYTWAGPLFWYSYKDLGTDSSTKENHFGLIRYDGTPKPAFNMLRDLL
jgi:polysaccharide biosynthesis protein PslG